MSISCISLTHKNFTVDPPNDANCLRLVGGQSSHTTICVIITDNSDQGTSRDNIDRHDISHERYPERQLLTETVKKVVAWLVSIPAATSCQVLPNNAVIILGAYVIRANSFNIYLKSSY